MNNFRTFLTRIALDKRVIALVAICLLAGGAMLYFASRSASHFAAQYSAYAALAHIQEQAAYVPAAPDNPVRQQLNLVLSLVLDPTTSSIKRLADAKQGLTLLNQLGAQVDAIGDASDKANLAIAQMQIETLKDFGTSGQTLSLIDLAKQRSSIIEDIRGLSYRANYETETIFQRIVDDNGALTASHVTDLNSEIPNVEAQFDHRSNLYSQLEAVSATINKQAVGIKGSFALTGVSAK